MTSRDADPLTRGEKNRLTRVRKDLLAWFEVNGRNFPWRSKSAGTFERICVEVLLQRTRAETVSAIYEKFFEKFPTWPAIANAEIDVLEESFKPIGLWQKRARSIKSLALYATANDGVFPSCPSDLSKVPAVGQYTANAILMFQYGEPRPLLDVNMARVIERYLRPRTLADIRHDPWLQEAANRLVQGNRAIEINWAVLDFAAIICQARRPRCETCFLRSRCNFVSGKSQPV